MYHYVHAPDWQDLLAIPKHNLKTGEHRAFMAHFWNNLPQDIKVKTNMESFKKVTENIGISENLQLKG